MTRFAGPDVIGALESAGIRYRKSGSWVRIRAIWRDGDEPNIAIRLSSGGWFDHVTKEKGAWPEIAGKLGIYCPQSNNKPWTQEDKKAWAAKKAAEKAKETKEVTDNMAAAMRMWSRSVPLDADHDNARAMRACLQSRGGTHPGPELISLMNAGARAGRSCERPCLVWPQHHPLTEQVVCIQREWGKGHDNKKMLGPHKFANQSTYLIYGQELLKAKTGDTLAVAEGQLTAVAPYECLGLPTMSLFNIAGLQNPPVDLLEKLHLNLGIDKLLLCGDGGKAGVEAMEKCARKILLTIPTIDIRISCPPPERCPDNPKGEDWLDVMVDVGRDMTRALIYQNARRPNLPTSNDSDTPPHRNVAFFPSWKKMPRRPGPKLMTVIAAEAVIQRILIAEIFSENPSILAGDMGLGKTRTLLQVLADMYKRPHIYQRKIPPILLLVPTLDQAKEMVFTINDLVGRIIAKLHKGRDNKNCLIYPTIEALVARGRAPHPQACKNCKHGSVDAEVPCEYMPALRGSVYYQIIVGVHAAGAEDSLLYQFDTGPLKTDKTLQRKLIVDEAPPLHTAGLIKDPETGNIHGNIQVADLREWRIGAKREHTRLQGELDHWQSLAGQDNDGELQKEIKATKKALDWITRVGTGLDLISEDLHNAPLDNKQLHSIPAGRHLEFVNLVKKLPDKIKLIDATILEKVEWRHGQPPVIPLRGIELLASSIGEGIAKFYNGDIVAITTGALYKQILERGGLVLNGTPLLRERLEVIEAGGSVHTIRAEIPSDVEVQIVQYASRLHGRGGLHNPKILGRAVEDTQKELGNESAVLHYRPVKMVIDCKDKNPEISHWGLGHKAHNRWKRKTALAIFGANIPSPLVQPLEYGADMVALQKHGIDWGEWDGSATSGQEVVCDGHTFNKVNIRLPDHPQARAWLLDRVGADHAQAIARARLHRPEGRKKISVKLFTSFPLVGHGIRIDEIRLEPKGRAAQTLTTQVAIAEIIAELGPYASYRKIRVAVKETMGITVSFSTIQKVKLAGEREALINQCTLDEAIDSIITRAKVWLGHTRGDAYEAARRQVEACPSDDGVATLLAALADAQGKHPKAAQAP